MTKRIWRSDGLPTPSWRDVHSAEQTTRAFEALGNPMIVKPAREGSTIGLTKMQTQSEAAQAYALASSHDPSVLCEQFIAGDEVTCPVMVRIWPPFNVISVARQSGGSMLIRVCGSAGTNYLMEATSDFNTWTNLGTMSESGGGLFQFEDTGADGVNARFYRAMSP